MLVDHQIRELCENGFVFPYDPELINPSSLDIRVGYTAMADRGWGVFDGLRRWLVCNFKSIIEDDYKTFPYRFSGRLEDWVKDNAENPYFKSISFANYTKDKPYWLKPGECLLVGTLEKFSIPDNIAVELKLKSSRAREGLSHALAGHFDNGFHGVGTLEIHNISKWHSIPIYPQQRIGQVILHMTATPHKSYSSGRYAGHDSVVSSMDK
jgi:dCTP deaminase